MKTRFLTILFSLIANLVIGQPQVQWSKLIGGSHMDIARAMCYTHDGGVVIAGDAVSNDFDLGANYGYNDYLAAKISESGEVIWVSNYGGSSYDIAHDVIETFDHNYLIVGESRSIDYDLTNNNGFNDLWIIELDQQGQLLWQKSIGSSGGEWGSCVKQLPDGSFVIAGMNGAADFDIPENNGSADFWLIKIDSIGQILWQKSYGGSWMDFGNSFDVTKEGGFIFTGRTFSNDIDVTDSFGKDDIWVLKLSPLGGIEWQKSIGGSNRDLGIDVLSTSDGGYIVAGWTDSNNGDFSGNHGSDDFCAIKLDSTGEIVWKKLYGGSGSDQLSKIIQDHDSGYLMIGYSESVSGISNKFEYADVWIVKINESGELIWENTYGGNSWDLGADIVLAPDEGYYLSGYTLSDSGQVNGQHGLADAMVLKLSPFISSINDNSIIDDSCLALYPNTFARALTISLCQLVSNGGLHIYDQHGRIVLTKYFKGKTEIEIEHLPSGIYHALYYSFEGKALYNNFVKE
ncbi:MAG: T9SS type A sorting domain-containing protein [Saprospiraceae bacterium]|nr:T9SS type A sorting domain-containing protein [Saprospiraceae bacterium]